MNGTELSDRVVALVDSLAWPIVAIFVLIVLLWKLPALIEKISEFVESVKYKDIELHLRKAVEDATAKADSLPVEEEPIAPTAPFASIDPDPRIALLKSWASVEEAIRGLAMTHQNRLGPVGRMSTSRRVDALRRAEIIDNSLAAVLLDMGGLRNLIAHGSDIPIGTNTGMEFSRAAERLASIVEQQTVLVE